MSEGSTPRRKIGYVLFDMDGLMIDSEKIYTIATTRYAIDEVLGKYGKEMTWDMKAGCMGKPEREAGVHTLSFFPDISLGVDEFLLERNRVQDTLWPKVPLLPGVRKLVHHLKKHNIPMAVATSSRRRNFELKTAHHQEVFGWFDGKIVCGPKCLCCQGFSDGLTERSFAAMIRYQMKGKPAPDIFLVTAATFLGRNVGNAEKIPDENQIQERSKGLVFEDAVPGMQAGKRAGMSVVWVPDPNLLKLDHSDVAETADQVITSLEDFVPEEWGLPPYDN